MLAKKKQTKSKKSDTGQLFPDLWILTQVNITATLGLALTQQWNVIHGRIPNGKSHQATKKHQMDHTHVAERRLARPNIPRLGGCRGGSGLVKLTESNTTVFHFGPWSFISVVSTFENVSNMTRSQEQGRDRYWRPSEKLGNRGKTAKNFF